MLPYPSKSLQPSSLLYPPPPSRGRIHAYLNLSNSSKERSLPPVILPLHPCPFPIRSIKTRAFFKGAVCSCIISCVSTEPLTSSGCWSRNHPENFSHSQKSLLMLIQVWLSLDLVLLWPSWPIIEVFTQGEYIFTTVWLCKPSSVVALAPNMLQKLGLKRLAIFSLNFFFVSRVRDEMIVLELETPLLQKSRLLYNPWCLAQSSSSFLLLEIGFFSLT